MKGKAFTLVELLIVLGVIVILIGAVLATVGAQRVKARDVKRKADGDALRKALELHYANHDKYPEQEDSFICIDESSNFQTAMANYISETPEDPLYSSLGAPQCYSYKTKETGQQYKVRIVLESTGAIYEIYSGDGGDI